MDQPPQTPAELWKILGDKAETALNRRSDEVQVRRFRIAGLPIEFIFAGMELADRFTRSFSHLRVPAFESDAVPLRITLWDEAATGVEAPAIDIAEAFPDAGFFADGDLARSADGRYCIHVNSRAATLLDLERGEMTGYVRAAEALSPYEGGKPLQPMLFAWYSRHGRQPVHAACVALKGNGVLIGGAGGSGKSTTSLACTVAGFSYLADDYTALLETDGSQTAWSLYASLWLEEEHSRKFAHLHAHRMPGEFTPEIKRPFALGDAHPAQMAESCTIRAVLLPRVTGETMTQLRPAKRPEAMMRMAPSSVLQLPFIQPASALHRIAELLRTVPAFWLDLGTDLTTIAPAVEEALRIAMREVEGPR